MAGKKGRVSKEEERRQQQQKVKILTVCGVIIAAVLVIGIIVSQIRAGKKTAGTTETAADSAGSAAVSVSSEEKESGGTVTRLITDASGLTVSHKAVIKVKDYGTIRVDLSEAAAPVTVANFVKLAESGFYDGLTFHRIMDGFMMQGGDPTGTGSGGSSENIKGEFANNGVVNPISHRRGAISMARSNSPDSASSQFFIVQADSTFLDGNYAGFGFVTEGMDVVDKICQEAQPTDNNGTIPAESQPVIESITIETP